MSDLHARVAALESALRRIDRQSRNSIALSRSTAPSVDNGVVQTNQGMLDAASLRDGMPTLYTWGFSSSLPVNGDKVVAFLNGDRGAGIVIATGHQQYRYSGLITGESVMHDANGHSIHMSASGIAVVGNLALSGNLSVTGNITATGSITAGYGGSDQVGLQTHKHTANNTAPTAGT